MNPDIATIIHLMNMHEGMVNRITTGFTDDDWLWRNGATSNAYWLLGHLASYRRVLLERLGEPMDKPAWEDQFLRGSQPPQTMGVSPDVFVKRLHAHGLQLASCLPKLTDVQLAKDCGRQYPHGDNSVRGMIHFAIGFHEAYHVGQLGLIAKMRNKPGLGR